MKKTLSVLGALGLADQSSTNLINKKMKKPKEGQQIKTKNDEDESD